MPDLMPGRSLRLPLSFAYGLTQGSSVYGLAPGGERGSTLLRDRRPAPPPATPDGGDANGSGGGGQDSAGAPQGSSSSSQGSSQDDNPFAPPPEGTPDRPWQPRRPVDGQDSDQGSGRSRSPWGRQWSDQQPGRSPGGFGERPGGQGGPEGPPGLRWDPTDPVQRRARYALLSGMWAFFFALFSWPYVALLLGALALYWGISSLRAKPRTPDPTAPAPAPASTPAPASGAGGGGAKPQTTAAVSGLVTGALALAMVAATFAAQLVYRDYYTCVSDALTNSAKQSCERLLPEEVRPLLGTRS
jgi:hypothetical protein